MKSLLAFGLCILSVSALALRPEATPHEVSTALEQNTLWDLLKTRRLPPVVDRVTNERLIAFFGIRLDPSLNTLAESTLLTDISEALTTYSKIPSPVLQRLHRKGKEMTLVGGSLANVPRLRNLMQKSPRGWNKTVNWSEVPGLGRYTGSGAFIVVDSLHRGHGSVDLILHEMGHTIDDLIGGWLSTDYSDSISFKRLHARTPFEKVFAGQDVAYHRAEAQENFAEMFAKYFHSQESRDQLAKDFPAAIDYYAHFFPEGRYVPSTDSTPSPGAASRAR